MFRFPEGVCPILATPFTEEGDLDYDSLRILVRGLIKMQISAITMFGIASEYYKLSDGERRGMIDVVIEQAGGNVPVIISITNHATELAVKEAVYAQEAGASLLMILPPFFLRPELGDLLYHIESICSATDIPIIIQYAPNETGVVIDADFFLKLYMKYPQRIGFKIECRPPGKMISMLVNRTEKKIKVYVGNAGFQLLEGLQRGAIGVMPGCSMADIYVEIFRLWREGRLAEATSIHNRLLPVLNSIRQSVEQIIKCEKRILKRRGLIASDYCRHPSFTFDDIYEREFQNYLAGIEDLLLPIDYERSQPTIGRGPWLN